MGTRDRNYAQHNSQPESGLRFGVAPATPIVKRILIANAVIFLLGALIPALGWFIIKWFAVMPISLGEALQVWRLLTYQFLHSGLLHLLLNMLVLFFFGPILERLWGSKQFLLFYLTCGATGGILYTAMALANIPAVRLGMLVGASGAIYGTLVATAILFPKMKVYIFGIFPLQMMFLVAILIALSLWNIKSKNNVGGELAHLAGMFTGAIWVLGPAYFEKIKNQVRAKKERRQRENQYNFEREVDRILAKVHDSGITSLTKKEKTVLEQASQQKK